MDGNKETLINLKQIWLYLSILFGSINSKFKFKSFSKVSLDRLLLVIFFICFYNRHGFCQRCLFSFSIYWLLIVYYNYHVGFLFPSGLGFAHIWILSGCLISYFDMYSVIVFSLTITFWYQKLSNNLKQLLLVFLPRLDMVLKWFVNETLAKCLCLPKCKIFYEKHHQTWL